MVLVSEVMLQQTQTARVVPAFRRFLERFPTVRALAAAPRAEVLRAWAGLGYNRRAIALAEAARAIVRDHDGVVPGDVAALRALPGVGPYTAAAVAALAFGVPVVAIDTNVRRVVARVRAGVGDPAVVDATELERLAGAWLGRSDPGAWNQAVMDLGRVHCRPRPRCDACPLARGCRFRRSGSRDGVPARRSAEPFEGSTRQLRGAIVRALASGPPTMSLRTLANLTEADEERVRASVATMDREGIVAAGPSALVGSSRGMVRLPR